MTITLTPDQTAWIEARVGTGEFESVEEAVRRSVDATIVEYAMIEDDDLLWAKPLVDEAIAEVERGEVVTLAELKASMREAATAPKT